MTLPETSIFQASDEPLYNIGVVTRMTGISMATLRAWERRYEFPSSRRTVGGHRLYSERDVLRLRWVRSRIEEGMQTSQAILALRVQEEKESSSTIPPAGFTSSQPRPGEDFFAHQQTRLLVALSAKNLEAADQILNESLVSASPEDILLHLITPTLTAIGDAWERGELSVTLEHMATNYLRQRVMMWMVSGPPVIRQPPVVLACAPGEWHEGSLLIVGTLLRRRRWPVAYLGQNVPLPDLATYVRETRPPLVIVVAMTEAPALELVHWPDYLPEVAQTGRPVVGFGGRIFTHQPDLRARVPGTFLGETIEEGLVAIENLLKQ